MLMAIARSDNASMLSNLVAVISESVPIAALRQGKVFAPMTFVGSCNRNLFEMWLEQCLLPQLQRGDVIVIDNASFHHSQTIDEIVAEAGCELWYLPPYSPDLNKIEHWWFVLKTGCGSDGANLIAFMIVSMPLLNIVLTCFRKAIHHFIANCDWSVEELKKRRVNKIKKALKGKAITVVIDETGDRKKGKKTDYVARQYLEWLHNLNSCNRDFLSSQSSCNTTATPTQMASTTRCCLPWHERGTWQSHAHSEIRSA